MANPTGLKKSNFTDFGNTVVPDTATIDFVYNGVNYKQTYLNFVGNLGVSGSIVQNGDPLGTPILDVQGSVNAIRNVEDGSGIKSSVSAQNGLILEHNFTEDTNGVELVVDLAAAQPKFRSLVAGSGINVSATNGTIQIALSGTPASTKTTIVNQLSDLPTPVSGVITLEDNTEYAIQNDINIDTNRFVVGNNTVLTGSNNIVVSLTYTGSGVMFSSVNKNWTLRNLTINCTSGTFVDFDGSGTEVFQVIDSRINAATLGTIDDFLGIHFDDTQMAVTTNGFLFGGTNGVILLEANLTTIAAGTLYDLGTATFNAWSVTDSFVTLNGSSVFLDGAASSANITIGNLGTVHNCRFFGTGTPLATISVSDERWEFNHNTDIKDTSKDVLMSQVANAAATVITVATTPVKLAGTWTEEDAYFFTTDATGKMTYTGEKPIEVNVTMGFTCAPVSGSNKRVSFYVAKNGATIANSITPSNLSSGNPQRVPLVWRVELVKNDYIEAFVANDTDTIDILVTDAVMRLSD